jgi:hypothetical protein
LFGEGKQSHGVLRKDDLFSKFCRMDLGALRLDTTARRVSTTVNAICAKCTRPATRAFAVFSSEALGPASGQRRNQADPNQIAPHALCTDRRCATLF